MLHRFTIITTLCFVMVIQSIAQDAGEKSWYAPDHAKLQFAGSMGMISGGVGYLMLNKRMDLDLYIGYLPQRYSNDELSILTLKITHSVWNIQTDSRWVFTPLTAGVYFSYAFGKEFSTDLPDQYPKRYYWWSEAVRPNAFIGGNVLHRLNDHKRISAVSVYYDIGTNELKLVSLIQNRRYLTVWDILHMGIGVKLVFR